MYNINTTILYIYIYDDMDKTAWKSKISLEWTDGTSPNWQLPILWSGVLPSSMSRYCLGTNSKMDRWLSLQRGFPILQG